MRYMESTPRKIEVVRSEPAGVKLLPGRMPVKASMTKTDKIIPSPIRILINKALSSSLTRWIRRKYKSEPKKMVVFERGVMRVIVKLGD